TNAKAAALLTVILTRVKIAIDVYINKSSIHNSSWSYWEGANRFTSLGVRIQALFSLNQVRPFLTATQKRQLKSALSAGGQVLWDKDFTPLPPPSNWENFNLGTGNMPIQYTQMMGQIGLLLKAHSQFTGKFDFI